MKIAYLTVLLMLSSSLVMAADNKNTTQNSEAKNQVEAVNSFRVTTRSELVGLWGMEIPTNKKCVEYYNFKSNNDVVIKSGEEWSSGVYDYQPAQDPNVQIPALILQVKYDNNQMDCSGNIQDQTGEISQYFVKWKSPSVINFCANDQAQQCFATLRRVLP
ncbi:MULTISPECIES: hypothetical protein [Acinetobacter]|jgi:hypothetical protein|uniref:Uncharacterized protein n=1 Tax=Acinetobacter amyesii TaxID=2942470 RepID=A0A1T1GUI5_9GAMM|nr:MULTISPECIES: hypothetical protein [Acinetobacter]MCL6233897.1 hypothetical protein [Acinetobacter amyesii]MCL6240001.1 hypothetical protein [Acinetobacter amyesii]MCL6248020.1 hypothetical protein [Acinetobacter amyesii]OOV81228.1 hypothetical protein B1202_11765 [Acinetobacter amyesii]QOW49824.1 hypothetical protein G0029_08490 [Acinetobacter sp. YH12138]